MRFARLGMIIDRGARKVFPTSAARPVHAGGGRRAPRPPRVEPGTISVAGRSAPFQPAGHEHIDSDPTPPHGIERPAS